jgi:hypothetical protein
MLDQVIKQFPDVPYFHIGFDEVYYKPQHPSCAKFPYRSDFTRFFMT